MAAFMLWVLNGARGHVNDSLEKNKCTPLSEETMASFDRNGEH